VVALDVPEQSLLEWDWTLETNHHPAVLPAFVIGYELRGEIVKERVLAPSWIVEVVHQYGGYACRHAAIVGAFLPLAENRAKAKRDLLPLEDALCAMSEEYCSRGVPA
jgi:hypothetical protein